MDYFHVPTPGAAGTGSAQPLGGSEPAGEPDYFGSGNGRTSSSSFAQSSQSFFGQGSSSERSNTVEQDAAVTAGLGQPTANPFQLGHPTAFPAQNGASSAFQQAILSRRGHGVGVGPPTVSGISQQQQQQLPNSTVWPMGSPGGRSQKRHHHPSTHSHKSVRTPIISSPRQLGSQSPPSSSSSSSSKEHSPSQTPGDPSLFAKQLQQPLLYKNLPKLSLSAATPAATALSSYKPSSSNTSLDASFSTSASSSTNSSPVSTSSQLRGSLGGNVPRVGASSTASGMRRGSAVSNPRFKCVNSPEALVEILSEQGQGGTAPLTSSGRSISQSHHTTEDSVYGAHTLILDLRPHTAFVAQGRIAGSINVCVPSTLLRRPNFGLSKISETLCSKRERRLFASALNLDNVAGRQIRRILLIDQESNYLVSDGLLHSLLAKLDRQGFKGELGWLKGGFSSIQKYLDDNEGSRNSLLDHIVEQNALSETEGEDGDTADTDEEMQDQRMDASHINTVAGNNGGLAMPGTTNVQGKLKSGLLATGPPSSSSASPGSAGSDSLFSTSLASSQSSFDDNSIAGFDRTKLALPDMRKRPLRTSASMTDNKDAAAGSGIPTKSSSTPIIRPKNLPMSAFQLGSTAAAAVGGLDGAKKSPNVALQKYASASSPSSSKGKAEYPAGMKGESRSAVNTRQAANPFFDNIRQNIETQDLDTMLAHIKPMHIPEDLLAPQLVRHYPHFLQDLCRLSPRSRAVKVNTEFFDIEQREQRRLQGILDWHCQQSTTALTTPRDESMKDSEMTDTDAANEADQEYHPFSISAGVEKGHLNRYKNMWPYEHARVRLRRNAEPASGDYINASHIRLRGSTRHYIASQGPLESTTEHFWQLVLQEKVTTIVMLTLLAEGGREKCYNYFKTAEYDTVSVKITEEKGDTAAMQESVNDNLGFFGMEAPLPPGQNKREKDSSAADEVYTPSSKGRSSRLDATTVRRTLEIRNKLAPTDSPFVVTHIQYIRWPDFDIPPDTTCVIDLIAETKRAKHVSGDPHAPILVHCSAGVGRTGTFIAVDTLLDRYKEERSERSGSHTAKATASSNVMDIDRQCGSPAPLPASSQSSSSAPQRRTGPGSSESNSDYLQAMTLESGSHTGQSSDKAAAPGESAGPDSTSTLVDKLKCRTLLPEDQTEPMKSLVDQMREQRMSSVANAGQYAFTYLALMAGIRSDLLDEGVNIQ